MTDEILTRAATETDFKWIPIEDVAQWNNGKIFEEGKTYSGLPYTLNENLRTAEFQSKYNKRDAAGNCYLHTIDQVFGGYGKRKGPSIGSCYASLEEGTVKDKTLGQKCFKVTNNKTERSQEFNGVIRLKKLNELYNSL